MGGEKPYDVLKKGSVLRAYCSRERSEGGQEARDLAM